MQLLFMGVKPITDLSNYKEHTKITTEFYNQFNDRIVIELKKNKIDFNAVIEGFNKQPAEAEKYSKNETKAITENLEGIAINTQLNEMRSNIDHITSILVGSIINVIKNRLKPSSPPKPIPTGFKFFLRGVVNTAPYKKGLKIVYPSFYDPNRLNDIFFNVFSNQPSKKVLKRARGD